MLPGVVMEADTIMTFSRLLDWHMGIQERRNMDHMQAEWINLIWYQFQSRQHGLKVLFLHY